MAAAMATFDHGKKQRDGNRKYCLNFEENL